MSLFEASAVASQIGKSGFGLATRTVPGHSMIGQELHVIAARLGPDEFQFLQDLYARYELSAWSIRAEDSSVVFVLQ